MLVLSRHVGEKLVIGDDIVLTVYRISGNRVSIAIEAPSGVHILRGELERHASLAAPSLPLPSPVTPEGKGCFATH